MGTIGAHTVRSGVFGFAISPGPLKTHRNRVSFALNDLARAITMGRNTNRANGVRDSTEALTTGVCTNVGVNGALRTYSGGGGVTDRAL